MTNARRTFIALLLCCMLLLSFVLMGIPTRSSPTSEVTLSAGHYEPVKMSESGEQLLIQLPRMSYQLDGVYGSRDALVRAKYVCLNRRFQIFHFVYEADVYNRSIIPQVNIKAADSIADYFYTTRAVRVNEFKEEMQRHQAAGRTPSIRLLRNTTLFVFASYFPEHYSHFFINNMLPLINVHASLFQENASRNRNTYMAEARWREERRHVYVRNTLPRIGSAFPVDALRFERILLQELDSLPQEQTLCYENAVIGLNNTCSTAACVNRPNSELKPYTALARVMREQYMTTSDLTAWEKWQKTEMNSRKAFPGEPQVVVVQRRGTRRILNLDEVESLLRQLKIKYRVVELEKLTVPDQIRLFSHTRALIAAHGNALGNMLWLPHNALVVEFWAYGWRSPWFGEIVDSMRAENPIVYKTLACTDKSCADAKELAAGLINKHRSVKVDIAKLRTVLLDYGFRQTNR
ncbi:hypothetical protein THASP1DRAFT_26374 [Thamnocephalis sphaerospora]|uniref:Glycosyltransferase 61 catalytic domain-containing protein n=1 Tax=Thamnocephalis sphaerospora TaxID=78915 RepID=A0A4P9XHI7_9FUNG|nr:hypothetical protein THASP1DRAFT_26374 [Thamnocephalis sphaerospora]|eukprot:RKP05076.1 hypothetical protein THASP1DRAFT_26374 [Thamnocephalis sphaerospora]